MLAVPGNADSLVMGSYNNTFSTIGCAERCEQEEGCNLWTYWGNKELCLTFSACLTRHRGCQDCQTGTRGCGLWESSAVVLSGGLGTGLVPNQKTVSMLGANSRLNSSIELPRARFGHISAFMGYKYYVCGGSTELDGQITANDTCDILDASSRDGWQQGPSLQVPRHGAASVEMFGGIYVLGGQGPQREFLSSIEVYHPQQESWEYGSSMWTGLYGHCVTTVKDGIFLVGGQLENQTVTTKAAVYDVSTKQWTELGSMLTARAFHGCSQNSRSTKNSDQEILVTGGMGNYLDQFDYLVPLNSVELYSFSTNSWRVLAPLPATRFYHAQVFNNQLRLYGGVVQQNVTDEILELDGDTWSTVNFRLKAASRSGSAALFPIPLIRPGFI